QYTTGRRRNELFSSSGEIPTIWESGRAGRFGTGCQDSPISFEEKLPGVQLPVRFEGQHFRYQTGKEVCPALLYGLLSISASSRMSRAKRQGTLCEYEHHLERNQKKASEPSGG